MNSSWVGTGSARARSVTNITAPLRTVTSNRSWPARLSTVAGDQFGQFSRALPDLILGQQDRLDVPGIQVVLRHAHSVPCAAPSTNHTASK